MSMCKVTGMIDRPNLADRFYFIIKLFFSRLGRHSKSHGGKITFLKITPLIQLNGDRRTEKVANGANPIQANRMTLDQLREKGPETPNQSFYPPQGSTAHHQMME